MTNQERLVEIARMALQAQKYLETDDQETPTERTIRELSYGNRLGRMRVFLDELTK